MLSDMCPKEFYFDYTKWLCMMSGCMAVWDGFFIADRPTMAQVSTMRKLKMVGVYTGAIPAVNEDEKECRCDRMS